MKNLLKITAKGVDFKINNPVQVTWNSDSNMNDFKEAGVYEIYGERTVKTDNLPIMNDGGGHSISCKLTVVASTLQPTNNEICVTQFLQLSNRIGGEGAIYVRTYNENNNGKNGWSAWQKQMGMVETVINSNNETVGQEIFNGTAEKIGQGLNGMIDNGLYSGIYIDNISYAGSGNLYYLASTPTFVETFVLVVINDYAATGQLGMQRHITQLKYAVNAMTGESTIKKRLGSGNETISWGDWENANGSKTILWGESSNMNDYKTAGTYEIYGERRNVADNLPILNSNPGHSIAAKLTVVDSSLRKTDGTLPTEICVTQFLMLSNRKGGDGNMYIRTYNENNSPAADWWTPWQKLQGIREGYIFTDLIQVNPDGGVQQIDDVTGLNNMVDNGIYSGIYTDDPTFQAPTFIDTFTLIVINNYAVAGKDERLKRTISQLKYAVDAITNQASVKKRTKTDGDTAWGDWTDIGGGGSQEVDVTDAVKEQGLPTLITYGLAKEGVNYIINFLNQDLQESIIILDSQNKLSNFFKDKYTNSLGGGYIKFNYKVLKGTPGNNTDTRSIDGVFYSDSAKYNFYISYHADNSENIIQISENMTTL